MGVAKRELFVSKQELRKLFGLPEDVEVIAVRPKGGFPDGYEFLLVSSDEVSIDDIQITINMDDDCSMSSYRKLRLSKLQENKKED